MNKLIVANWKMQLLPTEAKSLTNSFVKSLEFKKNKVVLCPDFLSLNLVVPLLMKTPIILGAQDVAAFTKGAYTGEVSAEALAAVGVTYVLVGHSERRSYLQESDKLLAAKLKQALQFKLTPILCVGENAAERKQGRANVVIRQQLKNALNSLTPKEIKKIYIAYEPVWAIGSGLSCDVEQAIAMKQMIVDRCHKMGAPKMKVLYGGSVKADNARFFLKSGAFDGLLVGGASLEINEFQKIVSI
jgi:triosephosphate isomerase